MHSSRGGAMYRRGLFHIVVLLLVVLVGSAVAQQLTGSQLVVNGSGPNVIGGTPNSAFQLYLTGPFSGTRALHVDTIITPGAGNSGFGLVINPTLMKASSGTHSTLAGILFAPGIGGGAAATTLAASAYMASFTAGAGTTSAATLYIDNAPSGATNNYSLWVAGGPVKLDSTLRVVGDAQFDGNIDRKSVV